MRLRQLYIPVILVILFSACVNSKKISRQIIRNITTDTLLKNAHIGICIWDTKDNCFVTKYNSDKYFVPASNVKIVTLYAALKYLPDTLPSFDYYQTPDTIFIIPKGDPTFLDTNFSNHAGFEFLKREGKPVIILPAKWETEIYGKGWAWDDYGNSYIPEKSSFPIGKKFMKKQNAGQEIVFPSIQNLSDSIARILSDTLHLPVITREYSRNFNEKPKTLSSTLRDSACKKMMFRSDNLIAEQLLLMVSNQLFGSMNETSVIKKLLSDSMLQFTQKPVWVDGSGLSRYNLFTPEDMVFLLEKLENQFGSDHIKKIFPSGNEGTLKGYYDDKANFIYAKTGTLSGQIALSGYLKTKSNKSLIFSFLINNHTGQSSQVRKKVAEYIDWIWRKY
jgi:D-alanyl-D-alanine carboxypeptidase/D-alanyl-D-alanine-endopeptidase (penicillin-binding protein 4)